MDTPAAALVDRLANPRVHVAVVRPVYAGLILAGRKTVECRLTRNRVPPFGGVGAGDVIYFKRSGGDYAARAMVASVRTLTDLTPEGIDGVRDAFDAAICGDAAYWETKLASARYGTLMWLTGVEPVGRGPTLPPMHGRAWVTLPSAEAAAWSRIGARE